MESLGSIVSSSSHSTADSWSSFHESPDNNSMNIEIHENSDEEDDCEDDSGSEYVVWGNVRRRKPKRFKRHIIAPRVLKTDIRRKYHQMLVNCLNGYDLNMTKSFLDTFATKDFNYSIFIRPVQTTGSALIAADRSKYVCNYTTIGVDSYINFMGIVQAYCPDRVIKYSEVEIHTFSNSAKSYIQCKFAVQGHVMYDTKMTAIIDDTLGGASPTEAESSPVGTTLPTTELIPNLEGTINKKITPTTKKPIQSKSSGVLMIFIDENRRIERYAQISDD